MTEGMTPLDRAAVSALIRKLNPVLHEHPVSHVLTALSIMLISGAKESGMPIEDLMDALAQQIGAVYDVDVYGGDEDETTTVEVHHGNSTIQ